MIVVEHIEAVSREPGSIAEIAIRKAMSVGVDVFVDLELSRKEPGYLSLDPDVLFREALQGKCLFSSAISLLYLREKYSDIFTRMFILQGEKGWGDTRFKRIKDNQHGLGVCQDREGAWYAFSPANYGIDGPNPLITIIKAEDLNTLFEKVKTAEGGAWPYLKKTEEALQRYKQIIGQEGKENLLIISQMGATTVDAEAELRTTYPQALEIFQGYLKSDRSDDIRSLIKHLQLAENP